MSTQISQHNTNKEYVNPAQLLCPVPASKASQDRNVRSFLKVLADEEYQHSPAVPMSFTAGRHEDLMNIYAYYVELSAP